MKKNTGKKVFILKKQVYLYATAIILAVVLFFVAFFNTDNDEELTFYYSPAENGAAILSGDSMMRKTVPGKNVARVRYCEDKVSGAVLMSEGSSYSLFFVSGNSVEKISDDCTSDYVFANSGRSIAYVTNDGYLYYYDTNKNKSVKVDENVFTVAVSPDGSKLLYRKTRRNITELYIYHNKKSIHIADNYIPLAVSDDASMIYVLSNDNSLYVIDMNGNVKSKLCTDCDTGLFCFSKDVKTVLFNDGQYSYISVQGKSRIRIAPGKTVPVSVTADSSICNSQGNVYVYKEKDFSRKVYVSADNTNNYSLCYINKDMTRTDISSGVSSYSLIDNGVVYINTKGELRKFRNNEDVLLVNGASSMAASSDGKDIYYVTNGNKLYSYRKGQATLLADGLEKMYMSDSDRLYFIMSDRTMYSVKNGKRSDMIDENVYTCRCGSGFVYYSKNYSSRTGSFELYGTEKELSFRFISDSLTRI
ncbi:MAG: hypothetical protein IKW03_03345 [Clostridia bacterium]|nr:hypothetical protein [Clostridia bacterium]